MNYVTRMTAGLIILTAISFGTAAILTFAHLRETATETALLETENSARRMNVALVAAETWNGNTDRLKRVLKERDVPPASLWGLSRWPIGTEVFFAARGSAYFLVRRLALGAFEFVRIAPRQFFERAIGEQKNVEWLLADGVNPNETSLAAIESGEANATDSFRALTSATVTVPGTNTALQRYFRFSLGLVFFERSFWISALALIGFSGLAFWLGYFCIARKSAATKAAFANVTDSNVVDAKGAGRSEDRLSDKEFLFERLHACVSNELIEYQCILLLAVDRFAALSETKRNELAEVVASELLLACKHGPLPAHVELDESDSGSSTLFVVHCPNVSKDKALEFAELLRNRIEAHPELALNNPCITCSAAVSEFHRTAPITVEIGEILRKLLQSAAFASRDSQERGGAATLFARSYSFSTGERV